MKRSTLMKFLPLCGIALFFCALPLAALQWSWVQGKIIQAMLQKVEERVGHSVGITSFQWSPFSRLTLHGLEVRNESDILFHASGVMVVYRVFFLSRELGIDEIRLENPVIHLRGNVLRGMDMPGGARGEPAPGPVPESAPVPSKDKPVRLSWKGSELVISSGTLVGYENSGKMLFQTRMSGTFNLERIVENGLWGTASEFNAMPGRDLGSMGFDARPPAGQGI